MHRVLCSHWMKRSSCYNVRSSPSPSIWASLGLCNHIYIIIRLAFLFLQGRSCAVALKRPLLWAHRCRCCCSTLCSLKILLLWLFPYPIAENAVSCTAALQLWIQSVIFPPEDRCGRQQNNGLFPKITRKWWKLSIACGRTCPYVCYAMQLNVKSFG